MFNLLFQNICMHELHTKRNREKALNHKFLKSVPEVFEISEVST